LIKRIIKERKKKLNAITQSITGSESERGERKSRDKRKDRELCERKEKENATKKRKKKKNFAHRSNCSTRDKRRRGSWGDAVKKGKSQPTPDRREC